MAKIAKPKPLPDIADLTQFDSLVVTPGLPLNRHLIAQRARDAGVEIIGDIELFARARPELPPHKVVGITGTNGKSTTTALVHHILKTAGVPANSVAARRPASGISAAMTARCISTCPPLPISRSNSTV